MKTHAQRGGVRPDKYLSDEQLEQLRRHVQRAAAQARRSKSRRGIVDELIVEVLAGSGLRASELCNLQIRDLPQTHGKSVLFVRDGKGHVSRTVDISQGLDCYIRRFTLQYRPGASGTAPLLLNEKGWPMQYRSLWSKLKKIGRAAGIGNLHPHMMRHTYLTKLYNVEYDIRFVQEQAGHASLNTTAIYTRTSNEAKRRQVEAM